MSHSGCLSHGREKRTSTNCGGVSGAWFSTRMSIDQYTFPFKHVRPSEYATIRPATVSTFEDSEKARLVLMRSPIDKKVLASGRITAALYDAFRCLARSRMRLTEVCSTDVRRWPFPHHLQSRFLAGRGKCAIFTSDEQIAYPRFTSIHINTNAENPYLARDLRELLCRPAPNPVTGL